MGPPFWADLAKRPLVLIDQTDQNLGYDTTANRAKTVTAGASGGLAEYVVPQWSLGMPTCRGDANLRRGEWRDSEMAGYRFSRRKPHALPALQITHREGMIVVNLARARECNR